MYRINRYGFVNRSEAGYLPALRASVKSVRDLPTSYPGKQQPPRNTCFRGPMNRPPAVAVANMPPRAVSGRLPELDVFRGLAAFAVLFCHYVSHCHQLGCLRFEFRLGSYGAHLFFMISGFLIPLTLERCKHPSDFVFSRLSRLYPMYWVGVFFSTSLMLIVPAAFESMPSPVQFVGNLTMLQTWLRIPDIEVCYWTLGVELKFYFLMLGILYLRQLDSCEWFVASWLSSVVCYRCIDTLVDLPHMLATPLILNHAHLFAAGMMFYRMRKHGNTWLRHSMVFAAIPMQFWAGGSESACVVAIFVCTFYLFNADKLSWIVNRPCTFLGEISYAVYLVHGALGTAIMHWLHVWNLPTILLIAIPTLVSMTVGTLLTHRLERPAIRRLRAWYGNSRRPVVRQRVSALS